MTEVTPDNAARATPVAWAVIVDGSPDYAAVHKYACESEASVYGTGPVVSVEPLYSAATVAALEAEVAYYKENFQSCMTTLNAINDAITEAEEEGRGFVPVYQLENIFTGARAK